MNAAISDPRCGGLGAADVEGGGRNSSVGGNLERGAHASRIRADLDAPQRAIRQRPTRIAAIFANRRGNLCTGENDVADLGGHGSLSQSSAVGGAHTKLKFPLRRKTGPGFCFASISNSAQGLNQQRLTFARFARIDGSRVKNLLQPQADASGWL